MKKILASMILGLITVSSAMAYTPPASFILNQMLKSRSMMKSLEMEGTLSGGGSSGSFKESLWIDFTTGKVTMTYTSESGESLGSHQTKIASLAPLGRAWIGIGIDPYGNRVRNALENLAVFTPDSGVAKIERVGSRGVWAWGEGATLKILKDEFLFAGYQTSDDAIEVKDYTSKGAALVLPKTLTVKKGNFVYSLKSFKLNVPAKAVSSTAINSSAVREWVELVR